jgi:Leucine-rich repeat (LRR) protein
LEQDFLGEIASTDVNELITVKSLVSALQAARTTRAGVRILDLGASTVQGDISDLAPIAADLQHLNISHTNVTGTPETIATFSQLELLDLTHSSATVTMETVGTLKHLQILSANSNRNAAGDIRSLQGLENLRYLMAASNNVKGDLSSLAAHPYLEHLVLSESFVHGRIADISHDPPNSYLQTLYINTLDVTVDMRDVAKYPRLKRVMLPAGATGSLDHLASIDLEGLGISGAVGIRGALSTLSGMRGLQDLDLSETFVDGSLDDLKTLTELRVLIAGSCPHLSGNLGTLAELKKLEALDLSKTRVEGNLTFLQYLPQLKSYRLAHLKGVSGDVKDLCPKPPCAACAGTKGYLPEHINLEGMHELRGSLDSVPLTCFKNLKEFNIGGCPCVTGSITRLITLSSTSKSASAKWFERTATSSQSSLWSESMRHPIEELTLKGTPVVAKREQRRSERFIAGCGKFHQNNIK